MKNYYQLLSIVAVVLAGTSGYLAYQTGQDNRVGLLAIADLERQVEILEQQVNQTASTTSEQAKTLRDDLSRVSSQSQSVARSVEQVRRQASQSPVTVQEKSQDELVTQAVAKAAPAVVSVTSYQENPQSGSRRQVSAGTGFFISSDGSILTNYHVVPSDRLSYAVTLSSGKTLPARVAYRDSAKDIAVLKVDGSGYSVLPFGSSSSLKLGQSVVTIGNALGRFGNSTSVGVVSGLNRSVQARDGNSVETLSGLLQIDAPINPGNSGGPLVNLAGQVVGINVAMAQGANNIGFAIPVDSIKSAINNYA